MLEMEERRETELIEVKQSIKKGRGTSREGGGLGDHLWVVQCSPWYVPPTPSPTRCYSSRVLLHRLPIPCGFARGPGSEWEGHVGGRGCG